MFVVKPTKILLFSSECKTSPASNLLAGNGFSKWKCEKPGTKQAVVELLLPEPTRITQLDIGNEASAFVEILVKRQAEDAEFQVLLPTSSFLSPVEAKEHKNLNRVRLFGEDKFISTVAQSKWDTVRVVCTQPFVNDVQYGLAFLRIYTNHDPNASGAPQPESSTGTKRTSQVATMALDGDNEEDDDIKAGSLFAKKKQRLNGDEEENGNIASKPSTSSSTSNVKAQIRDASDRATAAAPSRAISSSSSQASSTRGASPKPVTTTASSSAAAPKSPSHEAEVPLKDLMKGVVLVLSGYKNPMRGQLRDKAIKMGAKYRPDWSDKECTHLICAFPGTPKFEEVKGKGFIVSDKWIVDSFSAKRLQPWRKYRVGRAPSPPASVGRKFNQEPNTSRRAAAANAKSKLATSDDDDGSEMSDDTPANRRKRRKPKKKATSSTDEDGEAASDDGDWKPSKRMNRNASPSSSSSSSAESDASLDAEDLEDTDLDEDEDKKKKKPARAAKLSKKPSAAKHETKKPESPVAKKMKPSVEEKEEKVTRTPEKAKPVAVAKKSPAKKVADSDSDDDGGWSVVRRKGPGSSSASSSPVKSLTTTPKKRQETAEESKPSASGTVPELPDFLAGKHFLLFGDFSGSERRILKRIIVAFGGHLEEYMGDKVTTVVTKERWSRQFDEALAANDKLVFMKPDWLFACDKAAKLVPWQQYSISKA